MHEISISKALLAQLTDLVRQHDAIGVGALTVRIGPLSGVEPALLRAAYLQSREETVAEHAELTILPAALRVLCQECGAISEARPVRLSCAACGSSRTSLLSGDEMLLESVDLLFDA
jgi:hydrogenase nickel incorporation protein HypA/HybF